MFSFKVHCSNMKFFTLPDFLCNPLRLSGVIRILLKYSGFLCIPLKSSDVLWSPLHSSDVHMIPLKFSVFLWSPLQSFDVLCISFKSSAFFWYLHHSSDVFVIPLKTCTFLYTPWKSHPSALTCNQVQSKSFPRFAKQLSDRSHLHHSTISSTHLEVIFLHSSLNRPL